MAEPILTVEHLVKGYGENTVLDDVSFSVRPGEVVVVVGPSGCGKSTLLRCINALEPTQSGRVRLGNETVAYGGKGLTSLRQRIGMVFQSYELFPHLTVGKCHIGIRHHVLNTCRHICNILNPVVNKINLSSSCQFTVNCVPCNLLIIFHYKGLNRHSVLRRFLHNTHISYANKAHMKGSGDRRRRQRQNIHIFPELLDLLLVGHAETLLLIDDEKPKILKLYIL